MKRIINYIFLCSLLWIGCTTTTEGLDPEKVITVSNNKIEMDCTGGKTSVEINSYCDWVITNDEEWEWISVSKKSGEKGKNTLGITLDQNNTTNIRNAVITLANQRYGVSQQINITQNSIDPFINISENRYEVSSTGTSKPIEIESNIDWTASCDSEWVSIEPTNGSSGTTMLEIKAQGYISDNNRTATITVKGKNNNSNIEKKITVIQEGEKAYMKLLAEELNFGANKDSQSIAIESNCPWKANINADWINISPENGTGSTSITVSVTDYNGLTSRDGIVIFYNHDYNLSITLNVKQYQSNNYIEYTSTMMLPIESIDWGANILSHTYDNDKGMIVFDAPITEIPSFAFEYSEGLTGITIPNSVTVIGYNAFYGCTDLTSITLPNSLTRIGVQAFYGCTSLVSITIPENVTTIGDWAFYDCTGLTSITLPNSLTEIGIGTFNYCTRLASITIPENVTTIGNDAFRGCIDIRVKCLPTAPPLLGDDTFEKSIIIQVKADCIETYRNAWPEYASQIYAI